MVSNLVCNQGSPLMYPYSRRTPLDTLKQEDRHAMILVFQHSA
jgi:hypothetical protein